MKKKGIRIILALLLPLILVFGTVSFAEAKGPPDQNIYVRITELTTTSLSFDYGWNSYGAVWMVHTIYENDAVITMSPYLSAGGKPGKKELMPPHPLRSKDSNVTYFPSLTNGNSYKVKLQIYSRNHVELASVTSTPQTCPYP